MLGYDWPRLHALLNHLPVALLVTAVFFDLVALASRRIVFRQIGFAVLIAGVLGAAAAVISGLQAEDHIEHGEAVHHVMETHERFALISLGIFAAVALWRLVRERRMGGKERTLVTLLSLGGVGVLFTTGLYGGRLVFEHAAGISSRVLETELHERSEDHRHGAVASEPSQGSDTMASPATPGHVDPPGTPPHTHSHPPGTHPHRD